MRLKLSIFLSGLALLLFVWPARADLAISLTSAVQSGVGSNEVFFTGTLSNTSSADNLFLNNIQVSFTGPATNYLTADTNVFFANVPGILLPGGTYSDVVFGITIDPATPPGDYFGMVTVQGGADIFGAVDLAGTAFEVSLPAAALGIAPSNTNLVISWLSPPGGFVLQQNSDLTGTNWVTITNSPLVENGQNQVTLPPQPGAQFYRLVYP